MQGQSHPTNEPSSGFEAYKGSGRRAFLAGLGTVVASVVCGATSSDAALFGSSKRTEIPAAWVRRFGNSVISYGKYIDRLNLKHIGTRQVIAPHLKRKGSIYNTLPPKSQWKNMRRTLLAADMVAKHLGRGPKEIISAYRSPRYNAACPGAKRRSMHLQNNALDMIFPHSPYTVSKVARYLRDRGAFKGGVGRYRSFTHIDTRGHNADW